MSRHSGAALYAQVLGVWLVLASVSAEAQDAPAAPTAQPAPQPSTDPTLQTSLPAAAPSDAQGELTLEGGVAALNDGRYAQAALAFEHAIAAQGESAMLYALLGRARLLAGDHGAAQVALRRATQLEPNVAEHRLWFGHACRAGGYMSAAAGAYRNALLLEPGNAQAEAALRELSADQPGAVQPSLFPEATAASREVWYGWQTVIVDLTAIALIAAGASDASSGNGGVVVLGALTYELGPPIVHWAHSEVGRGFGSLGLRIVSPLLGMVLGCATDDRSGEWGCLDGAAVGFVVGGIAAMVIDSAALAWTKEQPPSNRDSAERAGFDWRVYAAPTPMRDGMIAGVSGRM